LLEVKTSLGNLKPVRVCTWITQTTAAMAEKFTAPTHTAYT